MQKLLRYYAESGPERVGFILKGGRPVEVDNICHDPLNGFDVSAEDLEAHEGRMIGTWHTHPGAPSNLSADDYNAFLNYPELLHFVIGNDGIRCFKVTDEAIVETDPHHSSRQAAQAAPASD